MSVRGAIAPPRRFRDTDLEMTMASQILRTKLRFAHRVLALILVAFLLVTMCARS
jgi:hypothetical protein